MLLQDYLIRLDAVKYQKMSRHLIFIPEELILSVSESLWGVDTQPFLPPNPNDVFGPTVMKQ